MAVTYSIVIKLAPPRRRFVISYVLNVMNHAASTLIAATTFPIGERT